MAGLPVDGQPQGWGGHPLDGQPQAGGWAEGWAWWQTPRRGPRGLPARGTISRPLEGCAKPRVEEGGAKPCVDLGRVRAASSPHPSASALHTPPRSIPTGAVLQRSAVLKSVRGSVELARRSFVRRSCGRRGNGPGEEPSRRQCEGRVGAPRETGRSQTIRTYILLTCPQAPIATIPPGTSPAAREHSSRFRTELRTGGCGERPRTPPGENDTSCFQENVDDGKSARKRCDQCAMICRGNRHLFKQEEFDRSAIRCLRWAAATPVVRAPPGAMVSHC